MSSENINSDNENQSEPSSNSTRKGSRRGKINVGWRCAARYCGKRKIDGVGVFGFPDPLKSPRRHDMWSSVVKTTRSEFKYKKNSSFLCSDHFDEDQFDSSNVMERRMGKTTRWKLTTGAVPSSSLMPLQPNSQSSTSRRGMKRSKKYHSKDGANTTRDNDKDSKSSDQICCLAENGTRCKRPAGNASFNYRVQKLVRQKKLGFCLDNNVKHLYICDHHKNVIQKARNKPKGKVKEEDDGENPEVIDLSQLQVSTLRRYKRFYKIPTRPGMNKSQLVEAISKHFKTIPVQEKETITYFIYMVKTHKSKLDQRPPDGVTP